MKKILSIVIILLTLFLSGCNLDLRTDNEKLNEYFEKVTYCLENNSELLYDLFAVNISSNISNFENDCIEAKQYYKGEFISYSSSGGSTSTDKHFDLKTVDMTKVYLIETTEAKYQLSLKVRIEHSLDSNDVGIHSLYLLKYETEEDKFSGSKLWTNGINLDIRSE